MEFVRLHILSKWLLLFSLFTEPLSAALGTSSMYKAEWLCMRVFAQKTHKTRREHGTPFEE